MNLTKTNLVNSFFIGFLLTIFAPNLYPSLNLLFFIPFIIFSFYQKPLPVCLSYSFVAGLILDLFSTLTPFGFYSFSYVVTSFFLYGQKRYFFSDHITTLPIMVYMYALVVSVCQVFVLSLTTPYIHLNLSWFFSDLLLMPALDALYAFLFFILIPLYSKQLLKAKKRRN